MDQINLLEEAQACRSQAETYHGQPEAAFLLSVAEAFEELQAEKQDPQLSRARA
jgi:hypothetical protein